MHNHAVMVDQAASAETCRLCGTTLDDNPASRDGLCSTCVEAISSSTSSTGSAGLAAGTPFEVPSFVRREVSADPDNPEWGPLTGIGVWMASVVAIIVLPLIAVIAWYLVQSARGAPVPNLGSRDEMLAWLKSPNLLLVQVISTIVAHAITIAICWAVVTKFGSRPFWQSLGWSWAGHSLGYWIVFSGCVILALLLVNQGLSRFLPQSEENSFAELLRSSRQVRIAVAILATFTAPIVEETVYRGVLFSAFRKYLGLTATVPIVTLMFAGVHVLQYWGAWVSVAGLTLLSLLLTVVRARTKSVLPCVVIHTLNNAFFSVLILLNKAS